MFNEVILRHFNAPYHQGALADADVTGQSGLPGEGPFMTLALRFNRDQKSRVEEAWFETYGCPTAITCGSWLSSWVEAKEVEVLRKITSDDLSLVLGGLPLGKEHCAQLAVGALQNALEQWAENEKQV